MGRPYAAELDRLAESYDWALEAPIEPLSRAIAASTQLPLIVVGSGGSLSAAHLAASLHQFHTGMAARALTPLSFVSSRLDVRALSLMILSAGGSNADILAALESAVWREPRHSSVICLRPGSRLARRASAFERLDLLELAPPAGKDGFLATNSLLVMATLLTRAYASLHVQAPNLPTSLGELLNGTADNANTLEVAGAACEPLWARDTLLVIHGSSVDAAAIDLESKFVEAALGNVQIADFRNFAHGRHHWLAKRGESSAVLALFSEGEEKLASRTLRLIPTAIPCARVLVPRSGPAAQLAALVVVLHLVDRAGRRRGIDPGRPGVPEFGRRLYGIGTPRGSAGSGLTVAIARKLRCDASRILEREDFAFWRSAYVKFTDELQTARFGALVLDYDGTLCRERDRFSGLAADIASEVARVLRSGVRFGIATGRGDSVRTDLRSALQRDLWGRVHIGYYNGADVGCLADDLHPIKAPEDALKGFGERVAGHPLVSSLASCKISPTQVSIRASSSASVPLLWRLVQQWAQRAGLVALRSSHSIDVTVPDVTKRSLLEHIRELLEPGAAVLSVGDKGEWPGNDFDLLGGQHSLSVDETSADPDTCWNLAPAGHLGVQATLDYFSWIKTSRGAFSVVIPSLPEAKG